jgi:subtilisin family serine protease
MYTPPEIINFSMGVELDKDKIVRVQKNKNKEKFIFNYGCGSKVNRDMLNSVNAIIIAGAGNDPKELNSYSIGCDEHILGVVGSGHKLKGARTKDDDGLLYDSLISSDNGGDILANFTSHPFFANDDQSTASILPGAWVAQAYYAYVRINDFGIELGTSFSTPTVSGILATSFALNGEIEPISITPSQIVNLAQKSVSSRLYVKYYDHKLRKIIDSSAYKLPIMKADCFYMGYRKEYHPGFPAFKREVIKRLRDKENCAEKEEL